MVENNVSVVADTPAWGALEFFRVYTVSGGKQLYRNGYQQLKVRVVVAAVGRAFRRVALTPSELDSIVLIDASSGLVLPKKNRNGPGIQGAWEYTDYEDARFRELPPNSPIEGSVPSGPYVYVKDFYVTTTSSMPIVIRPRITRTDGEMFGYDNNEELGVLSLYSLPVATYRPEQYSISRTAPSFTPTRDIEKVEVFSLELITDQQKIAFVTGFNMGGHPRVGSSDSRYTGYYVVGYGNGRYMQTGAAVSWERPDALGRSWSENGRVALVLAYGRHGGSVWVRESITNVPMEALDMYGNLHQLRIELSEDPLSVRVYR
jgi:hypothetical protein